MRRGAPRGSHHFSARVVATFGRNCLLEDTAGVEWSAVRRGRRGDLVVGDEVRATASAPGQAAVESIELRRSLLYRADAHRTKELAANIDQVLVVFASRPSFTRWFLWKALLAARAAGIQAIVIRNKIDIEEGADLARSALDEIGALGWRTLAVAARTDPATTVETLAPVVHGVHSLLVGQSGMGKSTLLNLLVPSAQARTREYSERLDLGKQTTTAARWFALPHGGALVDTPGFQEFGLAHLDIAQTVAGFPEFEPHLGQCRFLDCRHLAEPGCAVVAALQAGAISSARYEFYRAMMAPLTQ
ncbi:MAG TPA: ribosome small subunit-dependent GTPase A [Burkholderiaceae bacterium]|nr:ribosome small subunit-dependent GTPase A [Burkholderiaceae bacterium]